MALSSVARCIFLLLSYRAALDMCGGYCVLPAKTNKEAKKSKREGVAR